MRSFGNISSAVSRNAADVQLVHRTTFRDGSVLTDSRVLEGNDYLVTVSPVRYYRQKDPDEVYENDRRQPPRLRSGEVRANRTRSPRMDRTRVPSSACCPWRLRHRTCPKSIKTG